MFVPNGLPLCFSVCTLRRYACMAWWKECSPVVWTTILQDGGGAFYIETASNSTISMDGGCTFSNNSAGVSCLGSVGRGWRRMEDCVRFRMGCMFAFPFVRCVDVHAWLRGKSAHLLCASPSCRPAAHSTLAPPATAPSAWMAAAASLITGRIL